MLVDADHAQLAVSRWGDRGTSIVALHPGVGDRRIWDRCAPVWARAGYQVTAYDRRGFGDSSWIAEVHSDLDDLMAVTEATGSRPAVVIGNSNGGGLALDLALAQPDHVLGLVLVAPSPSGFPYETWVESTAEQEQDARIEAASEADDLELVNRLEVRYWLDGTEQPEGRVGGAARELMLDMNLRALRAAPTGDAHRPEPVWPRLEEVTTPVLVVRGEHDLPGMAPLCDQLVERMPNAALRIIGDSAHCPSLDQPEELDRSVVEFLGSIV